MLTSFIFILSLCCSMPHDATAVISPRSGSHVNGVLYFSQEKNGVRIRGTIQGLSPYSVHGLHIHEYGDISGEGGKRMGGHFNPYDEPHGLPNAKRHMGDLGNVRSNGKGVIVLDLFREGMCLNGEDYSILGRGIVLHEFKDDGSQPHGNAGKRIGVGVIGVSQQTD